MSQNMGYYICTWKLWHDQTMIIEKCMKHEKMLKNKAHGRQIQGSLLRLKEPRF